MHVFLYFVFLPIFAEANFEHCEKFPYVVRQLWLAKAPTKEVPLRTPVEHVVVTHTEGMECYDLSDCSDVLRDLQDYHMDVLTYRDIAYNFFVGGDGAVYIARGWGTKGMVSTRYNANALGIAFIGNYYNNTPPDDMLQNAKKLLACGLSKNWISQHYQLHMHEDLECMSSPAPALADVIKTWEHYSGKVANYLDCTP